MRKLLLTGLAALVLTTTGCYKKDYDQAILTIEQLEQRIVTLSAELQSSISLSEEQALQLSLLENDIIALDLTIEGLEGVREELLLKIANLENNIVVLNEDIVNIISERDESIMALENASAEQATALEAEIASLTEEIAALEAQEPEVIIEYITVVQEVIRTVPGATVTEYVTVDRATLEGFTIEQLQAQINLLMEATGTPNPDPENDEDVDEATAEELAVTEVENLDVEVTGFTVESLYGTFTVSGTSIGLTYETDGTWTVSADDDDDDWSEDGFTTAQEAVNAAVAQFTTTESAPELAVFVGRNLQVIADPQSGTFSVQGLDGDPEGDYAAFQTRDGDDSQVVFATRDAAVDAIILFYGLPNFNAQLANARALDGVTIDERLDAYIDGIRYPITHTGYDDDFIATWRVNDVTGNNLVTLLEALIPEAPATDWSAINAEIATHLDVANGFSTQQSNIAEQAGALTTAEIDNYAGLTTAGIQAQINELTALEATLVAQVSAWNDYLATIPTDGRPTATQAGIDATSATFAGASQLQSDIAALVGRLNAAYTAVDELENAPDPLEGLIEDDEFTITPDGDGYIVTGGTLDGAGIPIAFVSTGLYRATVSGEELTEELAVIYDTIVADYATPDPVVTTYENVALINTSALGGAATLINFDGGEPAEIVAGTVLTITDGTTTWADLQVESLPFGSIRITGVHQTLIDAVFYSFGADIFTVTATN